MATGRSSTSSKRGALPLLLLGALPWVLLPNTAWGFVSPFQSTVPSLPQDGLVVSSSPTSSALYGFSLPNPFARDGVSSPGSDVAADDVEFADSAAGLIRQARRLLSSDFGILDSSLLAPEESFVWIGPFLDQPLSRTEYLAAGRFFDLRSAFPDLDYRAHDFRIVANEPRTVRFTCRTTGTMRGPLRLRSGTLPPTGQPLRGPPETVTVSFNRKGQVTKLCTGFCMDRQSGNTRGATGVMAAAMVAGEPPSDWDLYPAPAVLARFFGRPVPSLPEVADVLAPFPETVMVQLAKGILATNLAADDPTLLADSFEYTTPYVGPVRKAAFLEKYATQEFANLDPQLEHFRVDPFDPFRVWVDVSPAGKGGYIGAPQAMSFTFDDDGFCTRLTTAYVMDPSIGNGGGLGGQEGYLYATDRASLPILTRPWARVVGRIRKQVLSPLTGVAVDEYVASGQKKAAAASRKRSSSAVVTSTPAERLSSIRPTGGGGGASSNRPVKPSPPPKLELPKPPAIPPVNLQLAPPSKAKSSAAPAPRPSPPKRSPESTARQARRAELEAQKKAAQERRAQIAEQKKKEAAEIKMARQKAKEAQLEARRKKSAEKLAQVEAKREAARKAADAQRAASAQKALAREQAAQTAAAAKKEQARQKAEQTRQKAVAAKKEQARQKAAALAAQKAEAQRKAQAAAEKKAAAKKEEARKKAEAAKKAAATKKTAPKRLAAKPLSKEVSSPATDETSRQRAALDALSNAVSRATVSLFGLVTNSSPEDELPPAKPSTKKAPSGVPTIRRWKQNPDGSVTGLISGSRIFNNGDKVTTSPIAGGTINSGEVVRTGSGSRYFLD